MLNCGCPQFNNNPCSTSLGIYVKSDCSRFATLSVYFAMHAFPLMLAATLLAQNAHPIPSLRAQRVDVPPTIDGRLNDPAWRTAEVAGDFHQFEPHEGEPAT